MSLNGLLDNSLTKNDYLEHMGDLAQPGTLVYSDTAVQADVFDHSANSNVDCRKSSIISQLNDASMEPDHFGPGKRRSGSVNPPNLDEFDFIPCEHRQGDAVSEEQRNCPGKLERRFSTGSLIQYVDEEDNDVIFYETGTTAGYPTTSRVTSRTSSLSQNILDPEARKCCRMYIRRNALCDPFRLPMPQCMRERLERENERRKSSVTRKLSQFLTHSLDLNREEDLI